MPPLRKSRPTGPNAPTLNPAFPLLLLETMRDMDRPEEVLEGEELSISMPRRLGLSDVVFTQIHRFREEVKRRRLQSPAAVEDLIRLVIRRPDAEEIFEEAGRRVATRDWEGRPAAVRRMMRVLPERLALRSARKAAERLLAQLAGDGEVRVSSRPLTVRIDGSLTARADPGGAACRFYAGVLGEVMRRYTGKDRRWDHVRCSATGGDACEWTAGAPTASA